jgi:DNA sulfur modification protein DndC
LGRLPLDLRKGHSLRHPDIAPFKETPLPDAKFLYVGKEWDTSAPDSAWTEMREPYVEALTEGSGCTPALRIMKYGTAVWDLEAEQSFMADQESAVMLLDFEMENMLDMYAASYNSGVITQAYKFYVQYGVVKLSHTQVAKHDEVLKRTAFKDRLGATLDYDVNALLKKAIPFSELPEAARRYGPTRRRRTPHKRNCCSLLNVTTAPWSFRPGRFFLS